MQSINRMYSGVTYTMTTVPHSNTQSTHTVPQRMVVTSVDMGVTALIAHTDNDTYSVRVRDDDSGNILPSIRIFSTYNSALQYAEHCTALC